MRRQRERGTRAQRLIDSVPYWYHRIEVQPGLVTPGAYDPRVVLDALPAPEDCSDLRVLDIGARDGFFTFEFERRGAEVVAIDPEIPSVSGFRVAAELIGSQVTCLEDNVYSLSRKTHGRFDIVLFLGVLYHLRHPLLALDRIADVCAGQLFLETEVSDPRQTAVDGPPTAEFWAREFANDATNWWIPSTSCAQDMLLAAEFECSETVSISPTRALFTAQRRPDPTFSRLRRLDESRSWATLDQPETD